MFSDVDLAQLHQTGRDPENVAAQLRRLGAPPPRTRLDRPARVGDGLLQIEDADGPALEALAVAARSRISFFVPASGAATRMTEALLKAWQGLALSDADRAVVDRVVMHAEALPMWGELQALGAVAGDERSVLAALFDGMHLDRLPKGLVAFHRGASGGAVRPVEQHLSDAVALAGEGARVHFTVGPAHLARFEAAVAPYAAAKVSFSSQDPSTDTPASDASGAPFRDASGAMLFRPGGHGALLANLDRVGGDVVLVRNIDNVAPAAEQAGLVAWRRRLVGMLVRVQGEAHAHVRALRRGEDPASARAFARRWLGVDLADAAALAARLDRPWRVAAMVPNEGQAGGGPFWAMSPDGVSLQIVEAAQVDKQDPAQRAILASATHFNPVDMVLGLTDADGRPHALTQWTDPDAILISEKSSGGRTLRALEHPGLWNGGMARWNTVFVEAAPSTFRPVKTLADLLGRAHGGPL